jgi:hypothetical protein
MLRGRVARPGPMEASAIVLEENVPKTAWKDLEVFSLMLSETTPVLLPVAALLGLPEKRPYKIGDLQAVLSPAYH